MAQWFGPKRFGFGIGPRSWQGWLVTALLLAAIAGSRLLTPEALGLPHWARPAFIGVALLAYLGIMALTTRDD
jgi:hypothetical protein